MSYFPSVYFGKTLINAANISKVLIYKKNKKQVYLTKR